MTYRIVEYQPARYRADRRILFFWRPLGNPPWSFTNILDAEASAVNHGLTMVRRKELRRFRPRVVKMITNGGA